MKASLDPTDSVSARPLDPPSEDSPMDGRSDTAGHVAVLRRRLLDLLDDHDET